MTVVCLGCYERSDDYHEHRKHLAEADHGDEGGAYE